MSPVEKKARELLSRLGVGQPLTWEQVVKGLEELCLVCETHFGDDDTLSDSLMAAVAETPWGSVKGCEAVYTDGSCHGNPGNGGWGVVFVMDGETEKTISGGEMSTTNNRMELMAIIVALENCVRNGVRSITVHSDSKYCIDGATSWLAGWKKKGWKGTKGPVKNVDLWKRIDALMSSMDKIDFVHVKGHAGDRFNEMCDRLANEGADRAASGDEEVKTDVR